MSFFKVTTISVVSMYVKPSFLKGLTVCVLELLFFVKVFISVAVFIIDIYSKFKLIKQDEFNIQDFHDDSLFVGPGCSQFPELTNKLEGDSPKAIHLLDIAEKRSRQNLLKEPEEFLPIYLNDENSWKKLK